MATAAAGGDRLGEILLREGLVTREQLSQALAEQKTSTHRLGYVLVKLGLVQELEITKVRAPCASLDVYGPTIKQEIYDSRVKAGDPTSPRWGLSGFYATVIEPGPVQVDDIIMVEATLA